MVRRVLLAAGIAGLAMAVSLAVSSPVSAASGRAPRPGEWWFSSWRIQQSVWPLAEGAGVTVAVLDTGVQASVPDLRGVVVPGGDVTGHHSNGETDFNTVGDGHGTMMSVLIAGQGFGTGMIGIAPEAKIMPVVINADAADSTSDPATMAAGIIYAANHGARVIAIAQVDVSPSASGCDPRLQAAVSYAVSRNIVVVAPVGSTNLTGTRPSQPGSCAGVLAVGAVGQNRALWSGSTQEPYVDIADPGAGLISSGRDGRLITGVTGTRAASALAAAAAALIRSRYPAMPWYQVVQRLTATALPAGGSVPDDSFGYGLLRLSRAVNATADPVPANAPNPVYAKYLSWLATSASSSRPATPTPRASPPAPARAGPARVGPAGRSRPAGPSRANRPAVMEMAVGGGGLLVLGAGLAAVAVRRRRPGGRATRRPAAPLAGILGPDQVGSLLGGDSPYADPPREDLGLFESRPYRIPPYTPQPEEPRVPNEPYRPLRDEPPARP